MAYDNSASNPYRSTTKTGSTKKAKTKKAASRPAGGYDWGDGKGKVHSIPLSQHQTNVRAQGYGIDLNAPASQPLTNQGAFSIAEAAAGRQYDPQIQNAQQLGASAQPWFQNYVNQTAQGQRDVQTYAAPILQQAQAWANAAPQAAPGLDPNSAGGQLSKQASGSEMSLAKLGADTLAVVPQAAIGYLAGQADMARQQVPVAQRYYAGQASQLQGQKAQAAQETYGNLRQNEQNAQIAYQTLQGNQTNQKAQTLIDAGYDPTTGKKLPAKPKTGYGHKAPGLNKYGYTYDEWSKLSPKQQNKARNAGPDNAAQRAKDKAAADAAEAKAKKHAAVQKATGKIRSKVTDIIGQWTAPATVSEPKTTTRNGVAVTEQVTRQATPQEKRQALIDKYGYLGRIAIAIHEGRGLDQKAVDYLKGLDQNFRVPREWLVGRPQTTAQKNSPHATGGRPERAPKKAHGHI